MCGEKKHLDNNEMLIENITSSLSKIILQQSSL